MTGEIREDKGLVVRHSVIELAEHWAIALSGLLLILSGMFELPMASRYRITSIPGLAWSGDFITALNVHYVASVVFVAAAFFHVLYHGILKERGMIPQSGDMKASIAVIKTFFGKGKEPPFHKYLPEQRLAYAGMAVIIVVMIVTGLIKTYKNIYAPDMSLAVVWTATFLHNAFFVLFIMAFAGHMAAIILKPNRPMVRGMLTGSVRLDYARHRHPLWMGEMEKAGIGETVESTGEEPALPAAEEKDNNGGEPMGSEESVLHVTDGNFEQEVLKSDKPSLVDFWAPWCGPCKAIAPILEDIAKDYKDRVNIVKVNVDDSAKTAAIYGVRSIPTLLLIKDGKVLDTIVGLVPKERLEDLIKKGLA